MRSMTRPVKRRTCGMVSLMSSPAILAEVAARKALQRRLEVLEPFEDAIEQVQHLYDYFAKTVNEEATCALLVQAAIMLAPVEDV